MSNNSYRGLNMPKTFLKLPEVMRRTGLAKSTIYKRAAEGTFPKPVKTGLRASAFIESEVQLWMDQRVAESRGEVIPC